MSLCQDRSRVRFHHGDACCLPLDIGQFDCVLASNIICRLHTPHAFLDRLPSLVSAGGVLVIISPYTFQTQFTARVRVVWSNFSKRARPTQPFTLSGSINGVVSNVIRCVPVAPSGECSRG